jgi:hypothetical protein
MSEREARILGAGDKITVGEKEYNLRPVVAKHLCDLERDALKYWKRQYLTTFSENADLLGNGKGDELIEKEMRRLASMGLNDIEQKTAYDTSKIPITDKLKNWIKEKYDEVPEEDDTIRALLVTALDQGVITPKDVKRLTDKFPRQGKVRFDQWWITACMEGMISFILSSIQFDQKDVTKKDVEQWSFVKIAEAARKVEEITSAEMGNT